MVLNLHKNNDDVENILLTEFYRPDKEIVEIIKNKLKIDIPEKDITNFKYKMKKDFKEFCARDPKFMSLILKKEIDTQEALYELFQILKRKVDELDTDDRNDIRELSRLANTLINLLNTEMKRKGEYQIGINKKEVSIVAHVDMVDNRIIELADEITDNKVVITNPQFVERAKKKKKVSA